MSEVPSNQPCSKNPHPRTLNEEERPRKMKLGESSEQMSNKGSYVLGTEINAPLPEEAVVTDPIEEEVGLDEDRGTRPGKEPVSGKLEIDLRSETSKKRVRHAKTIEELDVVYVDETDHSKQLRIGHNIQEPIRTELITFLKANLAVFA